jgi:hypothetical protein
MPKISFQEATDLPNEKALHAFRKALKYGRLSPLPHDDNYVGNFLYVGRIVKKGDAFQDRRSGEIVKAI